MVDVAAVRARWGLKVRHVREWMYRAPTLRERERWHALWLLAHGWSANTVVDRWGAMPIPSGLDLARGLHVPQSPPPLGLRHGPG